MTAKKSDAQTRDDKGKSLLVTILVFALFPLPIVLYMAVAELFLNGVQSMRLEFILAYIGVFVWFAFDYIKDASSSRWRRRQEVKRNKR